MFRYAFWLVLTGLPFTLLAGWAMWNSDFIGVAFAGVALPGVFGAGMYSWATVRRSERAWLVAGVTARAAAYATVVLLVVFFALLWLVIVVQERHRHPIMSACALDGLIVSKPAGIHSLH